MTVLTLLFVFLTILAGASILIGVILGWALCNYFDHIVTDDPRDYQS
jgi:hypothetical protein